MNDLVAHIVLIRERTSWETMEQYNKECEKRKARAEKFGTEYVAPKLEEFLPWTEVKRIRDSEKTGGETSKGFVSGIDVTDVDEIAKQEARKARFAKKVLPDDDVVKDGDETTKDNDDDKEDSTPTTDISRPDLPVTQCWDKEEMLGALRSDPPPELWIKPTIPTPPSEGTETEMGENDGDSDMKKETVRWVPEKIHLFSVDWAAFKQIRGKDLMSYFGDYGPTYVEWLGDLSCNVCFEDQHTARRALLSLGQDIPSPPPEDISTRDNNDDDDDDDDDNDETMKKVPPDFGNMTWRFCRRPVRKVASDKYGRKGTIARVLMRSSLSTDILQVRPNQWPAPPGGFSSTKVLGPNSDYKGGKKHTTKEKKKKRTKKKRKSQESREGYIPHTNTDTEHPMLGRGLSSNRQGFSVAEMEEERATKKARVMDG